MTAPQETGLEAHLHPIAVRAGNLFLKGKGSFTLDALATLQAALEEISDKPELGPALASLVQVAQHLDKDRNNKPAAMALLKVAMSQTMALEELNKQAKTSAEEAERKKRKAAARFLGKN